MKVEISMGDFIDRHSILSIKEANGLEVDIELEQYDKNKPFDLLYDYYFNIMRSINSQLWMLEDIKRNGVDRYSKAESNVAFLITEINDCRARVKKSIDKFYESNITEMKSHK